MLTLETAQTLRGVAETATIVSMTVYGDESGSETDNDFKVLYQGQLASAAGVLYTTPSSHQTLIKEIHVRNTHPTLNKWFELFVGGTANANSIARFTIPANGSAIYDGSWSIYDANGQISFIGAPGSDGVSGSTWYEGTGAPAGGLGINGDFYLDDATANVYQKGSGTWAVVANILGAQGDTGPAGATGATGATGAAGATGSAGAAGQNGVAGVTLKFNTATTNADPGSGFFKFNNATLASVTALYLSETDSAGSSIAAAIATWDDSTSTIKAYIRIVKRDDPTNWWLGSIAATLTDNGTWDTFTVTHVASAGSFSANDVCYFQVSRTGDAGTSGSGAVAAVVDVKMEGLSTASNTSFALVTFSTANGASENADITAWHSLTVNASRFVVPTTGWYSINARADHKGDANTTGVRRIAIAAGLAGAVTDATGPYLAYSSTSVATNIGQGFVGCSAVAYLTAGSYLEVFYMQNSGGARSMNFYFQAIFMGT